MDKSKSRRIQAGIILVTILGYLLTRDLWVKDIPEPVVKLLPYVALVLVLYVLSNIAWYFIKKLK